MTHRTYVIWQRGRKYETACYTDGFWVCSWASKTMKRAKAKGEEFVSGKRTAMRHYTTPTGRKINELRSKSKYRNWPSSWLVKLATSEVLRERGMK